MEWVETTGRTVEEAKKAALEQLGVEEADADFEVIAEPKLGLFGRLREEARVRARVQPRYPRSKVDRRDRRRSRSGPHADAQPSAPEVPASAAGAPAAAASTERASRPKARSASDTSSSGARRRRKGAAGQEPDEKTNGRGANFGGVSTEGLEEQAKLAEAFLKGLVNELGATATISSHPVTEGIVEIDVEGEGLSTLIGPKGATLVALQELTRTVLQRQTTAEGRVVIDVNGYRKRRQEALARFAQQVAAEVRSSGVKRALEPMPPADRKVVHDAVNAIAGVRTISEGEEPYRRVVLIPAAEDTAEQATAGTAAS